jgi:hypothetical protein
MPFATRVPARIYKGIAAMLLAFAIPQVANAQVNGVFSGQTGQSIGNPSVDPQGVLHFTVDPGAQAFAIAVTAGTAKIANPQLAGGVLTYQVVAPPTPAGLAPGTYNFTNGNNSVDGSFGYWCNPEPAVRAYGTNDGPGQKWRRAIRPQQRLSCRSGKRHGYPDNR